MKLTDIKNLHREYFEKTIQKYVDGCKEYLIFSGYYIFPCNKYFYKNTNKIKYTPNLYSVFLVDVENQYECGVSEITYLRENTSIKFQNVITVPNIKYLNDIWRGHRFLLNIPELNKYSKNIVPYIDSYKRIDYKENMKYISSSIRNIFAAIADDRIFKRNKNKSFECLRLDNDMKSAKLRIDIDKKIFYLDSKHKD